MATNPTIVIGSLNDKELTESINKLVQTVGAQSLKMAQEFDAGIQLMRESLRSLGREKINITHTSGGTRNLYADEIKKEKESVERAAISYDKLSSARNRAMSGGERFIYLTSDVDKYFTHVVDLSKNVDAQLDAILRKEQELVAQKQAEAQITREISNEQAKLREGVSGPSIGYGTVHDMLSQNLKRGSSTSTAEEIDYLRQQMAALLNVKESDIKKTEVQTATYKQLDTYLKQLQQAYRVLGLEGLKRGDGADIAQEIQKVQRALQQMQKQMLRPVSLSAALGNPEKTIDDITYKIQQLQLYKRGINLTDPKQAQELKAVDAELNRLQKDLYKYTAGAKRASEVNNALSRSWNYMKNRLAFYFTVGASTQFVRNLIEVRSQYEMTERSLGILVQSAERGSQIFQELSSMALVSPYTLIELSNAAKQLTAYDVAAKDVVDTTRRLADMASAVGVPMERLTYALGQIKAYGYLNSRDERMFLNAGIPLVKNLADHYSRLKGEVVSVGEVYDMIKKKAVGFEEVMSVITEMTDEGGRFFDFQAKMAGTLKVELANLTLAWNNMLNAIGESQQGVISSAIRGLKEFFLNWRTALKILTDIGVAFGAVKIAQIMLNLALGKGTAAALRQANALGTLSVEEYKNILSSRELTQEQIRLIASLYSGNKVLLQAIEELNLLTAAEIKAAAGAKGLAASIGTSMGAMRGGLASGVKGLLGKGTLITVGIFAAMDLVQEWLNRGEIANAMLETLTAHAKESSESISTYFETYGEISAENLSLAEAAKAWDTMREEIETASAAANVYLAELMKVDDIGERLNLGNTYLNQIREVRDNMALWDSDAVEVAQDFKVLGIGMDGLATNTGEYLKTLREASAEDEELVKNMSGFEKTMNSAAQGAKEFAETLMVGLSWFPDNIVEKLSFDESRFKSQVADVANDLMAEFERQRIFDPLQIFEGTEAWLRAYAEQAGATESQIQAIRIQLFNEYRDQFSEGTSGMNAFQKQKWNELTSENLASWETFLRLAKQRHASAFEGIRAEEIQTGAWLTEERKKYLNETLEALKETNYLAYKDVVDKVDDLNKMKVLIPVLFQTYASKPLRDALEKAGIDPSLTFGAETLTENVSNWKREQKKAAEESERLRKARSKGAQGLDALIQREDERNKRYTDALHKVGALTDAEEKANNQKHKSAKASNAQRQAESELQKTINNGLKIIDKVRSRYKELSAAGYDRTAAIQKATEGFTKSQNEINKVFAKWGLPALDLKKLAPAENPREVLNVLEQWLNGLISSGKVKPLEIQELETKVTDLKLDVDKFDATTLIDSLNSEFAKIKDEYELALSLDEYPELGDAFSSMLGIPKEGFDKLPRDLYALGDRLQDAITDILSKRGYIGSDIFNIFSGVRVEDWAEQVKVDKGSALYKSIDDINKFFVDTTRKTLTEVEKEYTNLVKKRGELADKIGEIEATRLRRQRELENSYANRQNEKMSVRYTSKVEAINKDAIREEADAYFEAFKNTPYYVNMFENLQYVGSRTLRTIKDDLDKLRTSLSGLSPQNVKEIVQQMEKIDEELIKKNPFRNLTSNFKSFVQARTEIRDVERNASEAHERASVEEQVLALWEKKRAQAVAKGNEDEVKAWDKKIAKQREAVRLAKGEEEAEQGKLHTLQKQIQTSMQQTNEVWKVISTNIASLGGLRDYMVEMGVDVGDWLNGAIDGLMEFNDGINQIISSALNLDVVGSLTGVIKSMHGIMDSIVSIFGGGSAKEHRIDKELKRSEQLVKSLQYAYLDLQYAIEDAYGAAVAGAKRVALANKQLELQEIQRQIRLEESRSKKKRDQDRILELRQQYKELSREIKTSTDEIVDDLLGSDRANFAENLVSSMIDAFKQGEDYMQTFEESFEQMVDNMIMKAIVSKVVAQYMDSLFDGLNNRIEERSADEREAFQDAQKEAAKMETLSDEDIRRRIAEQRYKEYTSMYGYGYYDYINALASVTSQDIADYRKAAEDALKAAETRYAAVSAMTDSDIDWVMAEIAEKSPELAEMIKNLLGNYYKFGEANKELSQLQQGIQGITETTANALEAYMNGVSQQVYLHSDLLTQIRDAVVSFDMDVQTATMGQILLQLQASYNAQMAIQSTLEGWNAPNGMAVRVQMV